MRAAAILGLGCSPRNLRPFQDDKMIGWRLGMPTAADQADIILLFGGDGTVHRHLGQLVKLGLPVLVVATGSGNDFARALGLRRLRDSLAAWGKFRQRPINVRAIDMGIISTLSESEARSVENTRLSKSGAQRYFCCVAGVGLDSEVARRANRLPRWLRAHGGYVLSLATAIFRFAPVAMKIFTLSASTGDGHDDKLSWQSCSDQPTMLAAFANTSTYGGGMKIAPSAKMDDGMLDVCVVGGMDSFKLFCMFPTVYSGHHLRISKVEYFQANRLRVETEHPLDVYADGEYVCRTPVEVSVAKAALRVVVP
jgi:diacylglycerol kinase (ATP)